MTIRYDPESDKRKLARLQREVMGRNIQSPVSKAKINHSPRWRRNSTIKSNPNPMTNPVVKKILDYGKANAAKVQSTAVTQRVKTITPSSTFITGKPATSGRSSAVAARSALRSTMLKTGK